MGMRIDVWSDVVCPWCYIGKRRLERALDAFPHSDAVEVVWHSFLLDPATPADSVEPTRDHLARKYGGGAAGVQQMLDRVEATAAEEGLIYRLGETLHVSTVDAHRLLHAAYDDGGAALQGAVKEALLAAYFTRAANVSDRAVLTEVATEAGMAPERIAEVLDSDLHARSVQDDMAQAQAYGATGVPFFVIDSKYGVSGAQPVEVFTDVLAKAWADAHPTIQVVGSDAAEACGPDGCAI